MKAIKHIVCPVSEEKINERITRINALFTILFVLAGIITQSPYFFIFLMADFYIRAFTRINKSPISYLSDTLANMLNLSKNEIGKAQKVFAARLGFLMAFVISALAFFQLTTAALVISCILLLFAVLELVIGFCAGCIIYSYLILPFYGKN